MKGPKFQTHHTRNAALSGILYLLRSAAYYQTCEQNSRALHAQTMLSGLALCSRMKKIPTHLLILYSLTEPSAVLVILR